MILDRLAANPARTSALNGTSTECRASVARGCRCVPIAFYWRETRDRARLVDTYPHLTLEALDEALCNYENHRAEIDAEVRDEAEVA